MSGGERAVRPPLKWAGGKYAILHRVRAALPAGRTLIEPFMGSAVVSMNTDYERYRLSDVNEDLVDFYRFLQADGQRFIERCRVFFTPDNNDRSRYEALRERFNGSDDRAERAALLLYLNRHGYNGLYRVNRSGKFNVPHGRYKRPRFPEDSMRAFHDLAIRADIDCLPFDAAMERASEGDVVYCDPPYVALSETADFTSYTRHGFGPDDQERLALAARSLAERGIVVVISNHDTPVTRRLYRGARIERFSVQRTISRDAKNRGRAPELLAIFTRG